MTKIRNKSMGHSKLKSGYCLGFGAWKLVLLQPIQKFIAILCKVLSKRD
jgi:hypothetical protein